MFFQCFVADLEKCRKYAFYGGGPSQLFMILHGRGGSRLRTPNLYYVICGQSLMTLTLTWLSCSIMFHALSKCRPSFSFKIWKIAMLCPYFKTVNESLTKILGFKNAKSNQVTQTIVCKTREKRCLSWNWCFDKMCKFLNDILTSLCATDAGVCSLEAISHKK